MPKSDLGPWGKWYASTEEDTAHYSDVQFRAWAGIFGRAVRSRGELPKLRPLRATYGEAVDFLIEEGRLAVDGDRVSIVDWSTYNAPLDRTAVERQRRHRQRLAGGESVDNVVTSVTSRRDERDGHAEASTSTSTSISSRSTTNEEEAVVVPVTRDSRYPEPGRDLDDRDSLDRFHELTGIRPWGKRIGTWLRELEAAHGLVHVVAALEVEARSGIEKLVDRVAARLERQAYRVQKANEPVRRPVTPPEPEPEPEATPEAIEAGRAAWEALRGNLAAAAVGQKPRGGPAVPVGTVLPFASDGPARSPSPTLTAAKGSDIAREGVEGSGGSGLKLTPSLPIAEPGAAETAVRQARADGRRNGKEPTA